MDYQRTKRMHVIVIAQENQTKNYYYFLKKSLEERRRQINLMLWHLTLNVATSTSVVVVGPNVAADLYHGDYAAGGRFSRATRRPRGAWNRGGAWNRHKGAAR